MSPTPVYIICSPRPLVGKTLLARLLSEFLLLKNGTVSSFDINLKEPSLLEYLPRVTETADVVDTYGKMQLMDRLILNDGVAKVIDLGFHAFDEFFKMAGEIGFLKEAARRGVAPVAAAYPAKSADRDRQRARDTRRIAPGHGAGTRPAGVGAAIVPENLYRPADLLVYRLSPQREGFIDRAAPVDPQELHQLSRARAQPDPATVVSTRKATYRKYYPDSICGIRFDCYRRRDDVGRVWREAKLNVPRTPSAFAPGHPSRAVSRRRRDRADR
jgi:hypothetical protein